MEFPSSQLDIFTKEFQKEILESSTLKSIPAGVEILKENQYISVVPIVLEGLVKVFSRFEERELLLYYIEPIQSCVMTFYGALHHTPSKIHAVTEEDSKLLLMPVENLSKWQRNYPDLNNLFFNQFNLRYTELLDTIKHLLLDKMDKRLLDHLNKIDSVNNTEFIKKSHQALANELGTAREVVSRILKKLEHDNKIIQTKKGIKLI